LRAALEAREATRRQQVALPLEALRHRARSLERIARRLELDTAGLERARRRQSGVAFRLVQALGSFADAVAVSAFWVAWAIGSWLACVGADWPPALAVGCAALPLLALAPRLWRRDR
jgi:hypothetical protein